MPICFLWCLLGIPTTSHGCYMVSREHMGSVWGPVSRCENTSTDVQIDILLYRDCCREKLL